LTTTQHASLVDNLTKLLNGKIAGAFTGGAMHTPKTVTQEAMEYTRSIKAECLVSIGGGSTTGLGKALFFRTGLPHIYTLTTYTSTKITSILGETENDLKVISSDRAFNPATVIYDANLTLKLSPTLAAISGLNAMAHASM
jgi:alcohol dehydrogenase class IV